MEIFPRFCRGFPREIPQLREQNITRGKGKLILREPAGEENVVKGFPWEREKLLRVSRSKLTG